MQTKLTGLSVIALIVLTLTGCQTTKLSAPPVSLSTICAALKKGDPLEYLTDEDKRVARELFTREGKDALKMARAIRKELKCVASL